MVLGALKKNNHIFVLILVADPINERAHSIMTGEFIELNMATVLRPYSNKGTKSLIDYNLS